MSTRAIIVGKRIRQLRLARGWSQRRLAAALGKCSYKRISDWETGKFLPALARRATIATELGTTIEALFLEPSEQIAVAREKAMKKTMTIFDDKGSSAAAINAATKILAQAEAPVGKTASASEEEMRLKLRTARDEFFRKLARLGGEEG